MRRRGARLLWLALAVQALSGRTAGAATEAEWLDPAYVVYLPPGALEALDSAHDRFELSISRRDAAPGAGAFHVGIRLAHGDRLLLHRDHLVRVSAGGRAEVEESPFLPLWATLRHGELRQVFPRLKLDGFIVEVEVREGTRDGKLVYRLRDADRTIEVSWPNLLEHLSGALVLLALLSTACALLRDVRRGDGAACGLLAAGFVVALRGAFGPLASPVAILVGATPWALPRRARLALCDPEGWRALVDPGGVPWWLSPAAWVSTLSLLWLAWHHALALDYSLRPSDLGAHLLLLAGAYWLIALGLSTLLHVAAVRRRRAGRGLGTLAVPALGVALLSGVVRRIDGAAFHYTGAHADGEFWRHAFYWRNLTLVPSEPGLVASLVLELALISGLLLALARFARAAVDRERGRAAGRRRVLPGLLVANAACSLLLVLLVHGAYLAWQPEGDREISPSVREAFTAMPELALLGPIAEQALAGRAVVPKLDARLADKLAHAGIRLGTLSERYPLLKASLHLGPRSPATPVVDTDTNVIVILVESLSSALMDARTHGIADLTPHLHDFADHALSLRTLRSAEFPTVRGEVATLASFMFGDDIGSFLGLGHDPLGARFLFLSQVLGRIGYRTLHMQSDFGTFAGTASLFRRHGYETVLTAESPTMLASARHPLVKTWGVYDEDLFAAIVVRLEQSERSRPFLLTAATTDTHFPYATLRHHRATGGNALLDAVHSTDAAFGTFWEYFKSSPYAANTLVLVTADHALVGRAVRHAGASKLSQFDYIAGMLYVPGHPELAGTSNDVPCSQLDLAPTLLDIMNVDVENPFLGLSLFSDRPHHPLVPGRESPLLWLPPEARAQVARIGWSDAEQEQWLDYLTLLARADRVQPPGPPRVRIVRHP